MIGILGGTFDPIHFGHLRMAQELSDTLNLVEVRFIPTGTPPLKIQPTASASDRAAMLHLAIADNPKFSLDERELKRSGTSYTINTLLSLREELGADVPLCLLLGADAFLGLPNWQRWQELLNYCHIVVAHRPNITPTPEAMPLSLKTLWEKYVTVDIGDLTSTPAGYILMQHITPQDISATQIREDFKRGLIPRHLMPECVIEYIGRKSLYGATEGAR
jgi:nicotinate-nucleotide adenylyltransferase